jgi:AbrB family looped-hinge helix DNA binding protein
MEKIETRISSQGQVSVPAPIRRALQLRPGSTLVWHEEGGRVYVARSMRHGTEDVHRALFGAADGTPAAAPAPAALKEGIRQRMRQRHARP